MPLVKRILHDSDVLQQAYGELCEDSPPHLLITHHNMSKLLSVLLEMSYLTAFSVELFDSLARSTDDVYDRIHNASTRTVTLLNRLPAVEKSIKKQELFPTEDEIPAIIPFKDRQGYIPTALTRKSAAAPLYCYYSMRCALPPSLWKIENILSPVMKEEELASACVLAYSHPGFFFQEWLRTEQLRQSRAVEARRQARQERKAARAQKKRDRAEAVAAAALEAQMATTDAAPDLAESAAVVHYTDTSHTGGEGVSTSGDAAKTIAGYMSVFGAGSGSGGGSTSNNRNSNNNNNNKTVSGAGVVADTGTGTSTATAPALPVDPSAVVASATRRQSLSLRQSISISGTGGASTTGQAAVYADFYAHKAQAQRERQAASRRFSTQLSEAVEGGGENIEAEAAGALGVQWGNKHIVDQEHDEEGSNPPSSDIEEEEEEEDMSPPPPSDSEPAYSDNEDANEPLPPPSVDDDDDDESNGPPPDDDSSSDDDGTGGGTGTSTVVVRRQSKVPTASAVVSMFAAVQEEQEHRSPTTASEATVPVWQQSQQLQQQSQETPSDFASQIKAGKRLRPVSEAAPRSAPISFVPPAVLTSVLPLTSAAAITASTSAAGTTTTAANPVPTANNFMNQIAGGLSLLKKVTNDDPQSLKLLDSKRVAAAEQQNNTISAILMNRAAIAGDSDSGGSDDSDNEFDDDDY